jgi:hypothetical protein
VQTFNSETFSKTVRYKTENNVGGLRY